MIAKSDDKTVVVTNLPRKITDDSQFLELFKPFGEVISAKLAATNPECSRRGGFGFVKFVNKEDAQQAIHKLNDSGLIRVSWVPPSGTDKVKQKAKERQKRRACLTTPKEAPVKGTAKKNQQPKMRPEVTSSRDRS